MITPTLEQIRRLYEMYPASYRQHLVAQYREVERLMWNSRPDFREQTDRRAGSMGDFFKAVLPETADELLSAYLAAKLQHVRYCATELVKMGLPSHPRHSPEAFAFLLTAAFLSDITFSGFKAEAALITFINSHYRGHEKVAFLDAATDSRLGADLYVETWGRPTGSYFVQVKPRSFFNGGSSNHQLISDRRRLFRKVRQSEAQGTPIYWWVIQDPIRASTKQQPMLITTAQAWELISPQNR